MVHPNTLIVIYLVHEKPNARHAPIQVLFHAKVELTSIFTWDLNQGLGYIWLVYTLIKMKGTFYFLRGKHYIWNNKGLKEVTQMP